MKLIKIKRKTMIVIAILLIVILIIIWLMLFFIAYEDERIIVWASNVRNNMDYTHDSERGLESLNFFEYDALTPRYKRLINKEDFYSLYPETMILFFIDVINVSNRVNVSEERLYYYGFKRRPTGFVITSDSKYLISFDFILRPHFITFKPTVQYLEITIYEVDKEGNRTLIE